MCLLPIISKHGTRFYFLTKNDLFLKQEYCQLLILRGSNPFYYSEAYSVAFEIFFFIICSCPYGHIQQLYFLEFLKKHEKAHFQ